MIYLLDANVLLTAHNNYYPVDVVPEFWDFLIDRAGKGLIKMPIETYGEVKFGGGDDAEKDLLFAWVKESKHRQALLLGEEVDLKLLQKVIADGYAPDLDDQEQVTIGQDPFLIAHAMRSPDRCVVTTETTKPKRQRANRKVPDVCTTVNVHCCNTFEMLRKLGFRTKWNG